MIEDPAVRRCAPGLVGPLDRGLCSDVAGLGRLTQVVGRELAAELLFTGGMIDAVMPVALELAEKIAANPPLAVAATKRGLRLALDPDWHELGSWVTPTQASLFTTEDHVKVFTHSSRSASRGMSVADRAGREEGVRSGGSVSDRHRSRRTRIATL